MKLLRKMLLLNWHYFHYELLDFKDLTFITGKNASGKSTIIDALQIVMLGDTRGGFFNKAANEWSNRTLKGYLRGEVSEDEQEKMVYLREGNFSSYIVLEFEDTVKKNSFCLGIVFDVYAEGDIRHRFFYLKAPIPEGHFIIKEGETRRALNLRELRAYLDAHYSKKYQFCESNQDYRDLMRGVLGHLNEKFFRLFRKAVPFNPIVNIKEFITDFICEEENKVEVSHMQENIRQYKQLEADLDRVQKRMEALEEIENKHSEYCRERDLYYMHSYLPPRAELEEGFQRLGEDYWEISRLSLKYRELEEKKAALETRGQELEERREELYRQKLQSDIYRKQQELKEEEKRLQEKQEEIEQAENQLESELRRYLSHWQEMQSWCRDNLERETAEIFPLNRLEEQLEYLLRALAEQGYASLEWNSLQQLKATLEEFSEKFKEHLREEKQGLEQDQQEYQELERQVKELQKGIKPYHPSLLGLQKSLREELSRSYGKEVEVSIFADLLEIRNENWHNAVEAYLHTQKFFLLVEPRYFEDALRVYERLKFDMGFYDLGLVDLEKVSRYQSEPQPGSLAEEVETDHPLARTYADYLLGRVIKCEKVEELRQHRTAITADAMLYHNFVARQLHPRRYRDPYIGRRSIERQIRNKQEAKTALQEKIETRQPLVQDMEKLKRVPLPGDNDVGYLLQWKEKVSLKEEVENKLQKVREELKGLDLTYLEKVEKELEQCQRELKQTREEENALSNSLGKTGESLNQVVTRVPSLEKELADKIEELQQSFPEEWRRETGEPRFSSELERLQGPVRVRETFAPRLKGTKTRRDNLWNELLNMRVAYNRDYKASFNINQESNHAFSEELQRLRETLLVEYREKIQDAKEKAQQQFQEDFISKLRANIKHAEEQIKELNRAIRSTVFGREHYKFRVTPNSRYRAYYDMITDDLLLEGYNLFSRPFLEKHGDTVEELFRQMVEVGEGELTADQRKQLEENVSRFTNYRTYLDFDLVSVDDFGRESRLSRSITKKSGGETQTPFYVAVLASFLQVYRAQQGDRDTLRLIVFDEAYSKMDHQRIQESLRLNRELGLQVILSAPTEKIGDIAPYVDRNLLITSTSRGAVAKSFDPKEMEEMVG